MHPTMPTMFTRYIQNTAVGGCVSLSLFINYAGRPVVIVWAVLVQPPRAQNCMRDIRLLAQSTDTQPRAIISTSRASYSQLVEYVTKDAVQVCRSTRCCSVSKTASPATMECREAPLGASECSCSCFPRDVCPHVLSAWRARCPGGVRELSRGVRELWPLPVTG